MTKKPAKLAGGSEKNGVGPTLVPIFLSIFFLLFAVLLGWGVVAKADILYNFGLLGRFYYITLCVLGLCVAMMLFGILRSTGSIRGELFGLQVEMGGPAAAFLVVILFGYYWQPDPAAFNTTVYVHGPGGVQEIVLRNEGSVWMDLGGDRRVEEIGSKGQAVFNGIPASFRGKAVNVGLQDDRWKPVLSDQSSVLEAGSLYLPVVPVELLLRGSVVDESDKPVSGATVSFGPHDTTTNTNGWFEMSVPATEDNGQIRVSADGFNVWRAMAKPGANAIDIQLEKRVP